MSKKKRKLKNTIENPFCNIVRRLVDYLKGKGCAALEKIESILYDDVIVGDIRLLNLYFTSGQAVDELNKIISQLEPIKGTRVVGWLFKDRLAEQYRSENKKQKWLVGDKFINTIKEIVWVSHYFATTDRRDIKLFGTRFEGLNRILGIDLNLRVDPNRYELEKNKVLINILSLGDARIRFLKYADNIHPEDLEIIVVNNGLDENERLLWAVKSLNKKIYEPYEHYHMFEFVRTLVEEAMLEKQIRCTLS